MIVGATDAAASASAARSARDGTAITTARVSHTALAIRLRRNRSRAGSLRSPGPAALRAEGHSPFGLAGLAGAAREWQNFV